MGQDAPGGDGVEDRLRLVADRLAVVVDREHHSAAADAVRPGRRRRPLRGPGRQVPVGAGDFLFIPTMQWHTHVNSGDEPVLYLGITNKRMLDRLGPDRKIEAGKHVPMEEVEREIASGDFSPYSQYSIDPETGVRFGPPGFITRGD
ncbi:cupin domain-containing protein [Jiangella aurantiaca]|uniref:cupin domain-containing protein n=1 Tax=Jiangella aurantiaca TaxID=2530373 RepID=UPI0023AF9C3E|nr:cupin domain-containing protein [Jiangella aurantiaca]